jgi:hypothetical protein
MSATQYAAPRPLSALLSQFPIRTLAAETEELKEGEVLVKCAFMSGETHLVAIADWQLSSTIALFAGHIAGVDHERIHLSVHCDELGSNCPMKKVKELLEKTGGEVNVLVKSAPKIAMNWNKTDILVGRHRYAGFARSAAAQAGAGDAW